MSSNNIHERRLPIIPAFIKMSFVNTVKDGTGLLNRALYLCKVDSFEVVNKAIFVFNSSIMYIKLELE